MRIAQCLTATFVSNEMYKEVQLEIIKDGWQIEILSQSIK